MQRCVRRAHFIKKPRLNEMIEVNSIAPAADTLAHIGAVVIGRNEGRRLDACLAALAPLDGRIVYVDSGSTDNSMAIAARHGAHAINLDMTQQFTAARARNVGWRALAKKCPDIKAVQFVDGDCELVGGWLEAAAYTLEQDTTLAAVCGQRMERRPGASAYNYLCHVEWNTPVGVARAIGGDALVRLDALDAVGGYNDHFIAGEEPEMCVRLRALGWRILRIDQQMTLHDANIMRFSQWWQRTRRGGYAFALGAHAHGAPPERHFVRETRRAVIWGGAVPIAAAVGSLLTPWALALFSLYPLQIIRLAAKSKQDRPFIHAAFLTLGKFPEALGVFNCWMDRLRARRRSIIEY